MNNANNNNNNNNNTNATSVFMDHVKQVLLTLPPVTKFALFFPTLFLILDVFTSFSSYIYLESDKVLYYFQIHRLLLYPIASKSFLEMLVTTFWLFPEIYKAEKRMGTLRLIWTLLTLLTLLPGIIYCIAIYLLSVFSPDFGFSLAKYYGMAGWVVGLVIINYLKQEGEPDRMIAGSIRIPNKVWPVIVLVFFVFLAPGASFILNLSAALLGFVYIDEKYSKYFTPSEETIVHYEEKPWLKWLTGLPHFISVDSSGIYLPIVNPSPISYQQSSPNPATTTNFPGTGIRLGS